MKQKIIDIILKHLEKYRLESIDIQNNQYPLYIFKENKALNSFEGLLFVDTKDKNIFDFFKSKFMPSVSGYLPRIGIMINGNNIIIKDFMKSDRYIVKNINKISPLFIDKLERSLTDLNNKKFRMSLFDRKDIIEEFYQLYRKSREFLLEEISGINGELERREFVDNFMIQMLTLWYLQEREFFDKDVSYFINKFEQTKQKRLTEGFDNYYQFLTSLFEKIRGETDTPYYEDDIFGKVFVIGPAVFINGNKEYSAINIPNECFFQNNVTEILINTPPKKVGIEVPLLNLFESRDWTEGNIDEYVLGSLYEKLITTEERKKTGAYYTPEEITEYISDNTVNPLILEKINKEFQTDFDSVKDAIENSNEKMLKYIFVLLKDLKILDPAVGSAHFLESSINSLLKIYEQIWKKAQTLDIKNGLEITSTDENGNLKRKYLIDIVDEDEFKLNIKFFIILSKNIYGVDINSSALKVAKARLFLSLAKHFRENHCCIRFPNVHFNLRHGNSLVGYSDFKSNSLQKSLDSFGFTESSLYEKEFIEILDEIKTHIEKVSDNLNLSNNIFNEIYELNSLISKNELEWDELKKILLIKEKLTTILIVSLNSKYAMAINKILNDITEGFKVHLDKKYSKEYNIEYKVLKKLGTFHWFFEFPEIFLVDVSRKEVGFDIVLGNPPYVRQEEINHIVENIDYKEILSKIYLPFDNSFDFSMFFILRSLSLTKTKGYHSFIITNKWLRAKYGKMIRDLLSKKTTLLKIIDFNGIKVFIGATVDTMIYILKNTGPISSHEIRYVTPSSLENINENNISIKQKNLNTCIWSFHNSDIDPIISFINRTTKTVGELDFKIYRGFTTGYNEAFIINRDLRNKILDEEDNKVTTILNPLLRGKDINRYWIDYKDLWIINSHNGYYDSKGIYNPPIDIPNKHPFLWHYFSEFNQKVNGDIENRCDKGSHWTNLRNCTYVQEFKKPKIIWQEISSSSNYFWDEEGIFFVSNNAYIMTNVGKEYLIIFNSNLITKIFESISQLLASGYRHTKQYVDKIPIKSIFEVDCYQVLVEYLSFLNFSDERRKKYSEQIKFFDKIIADSLIYELYFVDKFYEDGIYDECKYYFHEIVSKYLNKIDYKRWYSLYCKNMIQYNVDLESLTEYNQLELEIMNTIESAYNSLSNNPELIHLLNKLKSHPWVKILEY